jgi:hypothetical protein
MRLSTILCYEMKSHLSDLAFVRSQSAISAADHRPPFPRMSSENDEQDVDIVKRQFLQQIPVRHFKWPLSIASIQELLWEQVRSS